MVAALLGNPRPGSWGPKCWGAGRLLKKKFPWEASEEEVSPPSSQLHTQLYEDPKWAGPQRQIFGIFSLLNRPRVGWKVRFAGGELNLPFPLGTTVRSLASSPRGGFASEPDPTSPRNRPFALKARA